MTYDEVAERAVLGSMLHDESLAHVIMLRIREDDFFIEKHRQLYTVLREYFSIYAHIDYILLKNFIEEKTDIDMLFIEELALEHIPDEEILIHIISHVKELARKRKLSIELQQAISSIEHQNTSEIVSRILEVVEQNDEIPDITTASNVALEVIDIIEKFAHQKELVTGIPTGFIDLDRLTTGFHESDLVIVAARPGMGKSSFMLSVMHNIAKKDIPVGIFSLEMSKEQLIIRLLSSVSKIDMQKLRTGMVTEEEIKALRRVYEEEIENLPIYIDDSPAISISDLRIKARKLVKEKDVKIIAVDYLQLVRPIRAKANRQEEVAEISRNLKALAKELKIPVIALAQLSRQTEQRADKRPLLSDLRESGQIEQDADLIIFLHRPEYYKKNPLPEEKGLVEVIIAKQRQGPTGIVRLGFISSYVSFTHLSQNQIKEEIKEEEKEIEEIEEYDIPF